MVLPELCDRFSVSVVLRHVRGTTSILSGLAFDGDFEGEHTGFDDVLVVQGPFGSDFFAVEKRSITTVQVSYGAGSFPTHQFEVLLRQSPIQSKRPVRVFAASNDDCLPSP